MEMKKELIVVEQLPVIKQYLEELSVEIEKEVESALSLEVNADTVKEVKKVRSGLNATFKELETKRKMVKTKVLEPYEAFENIYKECVSNKFKNADLQLKTKIDEVESNLKEEKTEEVKDYFKEYAESKSVDFIKYEDMQLNVTLTASMKSLKASVDDFVDRVVSDLELLETQDDKEEMLVEYKKDLNVSRAITEVKTRKEALAKELEKQEEIKAQKEVEAKVVEKVEEKITAPGATKEVEIRKPVVFQVFINEEEFNKINKFMKEEGIKYEWKTSKKN